MSNLWEKKQESIELVDRLRVRNYSVSFHTNHAAQIEGSLMPKSDNLRASYG